MDQKKITNIARNYLSLRGNCSFDAQNAISCIEEGGADCKRYVTSFKLCLLDEWCFDEKRELQTCIERNRAKMQRSDLATMCKPFEAKVRQQKIESLCSFF